MGGLFLLALGVEWFFDSGQWPPTPMDPILNATARPWTHLAIALPVMAWSAGFFWVSFSRIPRTGFIDPWMFTNASALLLYVAGLFGALMPWMAGHPAQPPAFLFFPGEAIAITAIVMLAKRCMARAELQADMGVRELEALMPETALVVQRCTGGTGWQAVSAPIAHITPGSILLVQPGGTTPADGVVCQGAGVVDESALAGASALVDKLPGSAVFAGSLNNEGKFLLKAERIGGDTLLAHMIEAARAAQNSHMGLARRSDIVLQAVLAIGLLTALVSAAVWGMHSSPSSCCMAVLAVSSVLAALAPGMLNRANPLAVRSACGRAARAGILVRTAQAFEHMTRVETLITDKTGILTEPEPAVVSIVNSKAFQQTELIRIAASLEQGIDHPIAHALAALAQERSISLSPASEICYTPGWGVCGLVEGKHVALGGRKLLDTLHVPIDHVEEQAGRLRDNAETLIFLALDGRFAALIGIENAILPYAHDALRRIEEEGVQLILATGDHPETAQAVAQRLHIHDVKASFEPGGKTAAIESVLQETEYAAVAGDARVDAAILKRVPASISMTWRPDASSETAFTLVRGDIEGIARALTLSSTMIETMKRIQTFSICYHIIAIPVAAGALYALLGFLAPPFTFALLSACATLATARQAVRLATLPL